MNGRMDDRWRALAIGASGTALAAIDLAGGIATELGWAMIPAAGSVEDRSVLVVECAGVEATALLDGLAFLADLAAARGWPIVASFARDQLEPVAAMLMGAGVELLCEPAPIDWIAPLLIAARRGGVPDALVGETDGERLRRLHAEVARIAAMLARLADDPREAFGHDLADRHLGYDAGPGVDAADPQTIRQAIRSRRLRDEFFAGGLFEDPAWDILLDLFASELEGRRVSVSSLCIAAAVPSTTALRWVTRMTAAGLLERVPDPHDRRRAFMTLSTRARGAMRGYIAAASRTGMPIA